jgi:hypothetical protein
MGHAFPSNFEAVRPYGSRGDLKCDGFRASDGTVFQCYAPDTTKLKQLLRKIDDDFHGALEHWGAKMRRWELVHNDVRGLPADVTRHLASLRIAHPTLEIAVCSYPELQKLTVGLNKDQLEDLFGAIAYQPRRRERRVLQQLTGYLTSENYHVFENMISDALDDVIGLKITVDKSGDDDVLQAGASDDQLVVYLRGLNGSSEFVVNGEYAYQHGMYVLDGFFLVKSGGMHQGIVSFGLMPMDEGRVRLGDFEVISITLPS